MSEKVRTKTGAIITVYRPKPYDKTSRVAFKGLAFLNLRMDDPTDGRFAEVALTKKERLALAAALLGVKKK